MAEVYVAQEPKNRVIRDRVQTACALAMETLTITLFLAVPCHSLRTLVARRIEEPRVWRSMRSLRAWASFVSASSRYERDIAPACAHCKNTSA